jgi:trypsin
VRNRNQQLPGGSALWAAAALVASSLPACADTGSADSGDAFGQLVAPLSGAQTDPDHAAVLAIVTVTARTVELCTGTLIAPNLVLTARHCVAPTASEEVDCSTAVFDAPYPPRRMWVNRTGQLSGPLESYGLLGVFGDTSEFVAVTEVDVPDGDELVCGADLALLILAEQFPGGDIVPIAPRLDAPVLESENYAAVGFGTTPAESGLGTRRVKRDLEVVCGSDQCQPASIVAATEFIGGDGVCSGDSGGPALADDGRVVGVASRSRNCAAPVYTAVSSWREWIRDIAGRAAERGTYRRPDWLVAASEQLFMTGAQRVSERAMSTDLAVTEPAPAEAPPDGADPAAEADPEGVSPDPGDAARPGDAGAGDAAPGGVTTASRGQDSGCSIGPAAPVSRSWGYLLVFGAWVLCRRRRPAAG